LQLVIYLSESIINPPIFMCWYNQEAINQFLAVFNINFLWEIFYFYDFNNDIRNLPSLFLSKGGKDHSEYKFI
jgi:hypothetical protein